MFLICLFFVIQCIFGHKSQGTPPTEFSPMIVFLSFACAVANFCSVFFFFDSPAAISRLSCHHLCKEEEEEEAGDSAVVVVVVVVEERGAEGLRQRRPLPPHRAAAVAWIGTTASWSPTNFTLLHRKMASQWQEKSRRRQAKTATTIMQGAGGRCFQEWTAATNQKRRGKGSLAPAVAGTGLGQALGVQSHGITATCLHRPRLDLELTQGAIGTRPSLEGRCLLKRGAVLVVRSWSFFSILSAGLVGLGPFACCSGFFFS
jgi:hypothetical protein